MHSKKIYVLEGIKLFCWSSASRYGVCWAPGICPSKQGNRIFFLGGAPVRQILFTPNDREIMGVIITREIYSLMWAINHRQVLWTLWMRVQCVSPRPPGPLISDFHQKETVFKMDANKMSHTTKDSAKGWNMYTKSLFFYFILAYWEAAPVKK